MAGRRSKARHFALQALYQWQLSGQDIGDVEAQFLERQELAKTDVGLFVGLLRGIAADVSVLDEAVDPLLSRPISQVDPVELAVLRIGVFELMQHQDVPYRVVIDEAVELAKVFGADQSHKFVNGVLDKLVPRLRPLEAGNRQTGNRQTGGKKRPGVG
jgi:N utilization substance protein B